MSAAERVLAWSRWAAHARLAEASGTPIAAPSSEVPVELLRSASVGPLVGAVLGDGPLADDSRATWAANITLRAALADLCERFERAALRVVALKGWATLVRFPSWMPARGTRDIDLLVAPEDFAAACAIMHAAGYEELSSAEPISRWWSGQREFRSERAGFRVAVDLHRGLHHPPVWQALTAAVLDASVRVDGVRVPTPAAALWVIAAHRTRHAWTGDPREWIDAWLLARDLDDDAAQAWAAGARALGIDGASWALWRDVSAWLAPPVTPWHAAAQALGRSLSDRRRADVEAWRRGARPLPRLIARFRFIDMYRPLPAMGAPRGHALAGALLHAGFRAADAWWSDDAGVLRDSTRPGVGRTRE